MKAIKCTLTPALIFCLCASLSGTLFVLAASAKITPKEVDEPTKFYQIREGDTLGGLANLDIVVARVRVPMTRLSHMRRFFSASQRPSAMFSPARWNTASAPSKADVLGIPSNGHQYTVSAPMGLSNLISLTT